MKVNQLPPEYMEFIFIVKYTDQIRFIVFKLTILHLFSLLTDPTRLVSNCIDTSHTTNNFEQCLYQYYPVIEYHQCNY